MENEKRGTVLVVDDENGVHESVKEIFSPDYDILSAFNAKEGFALIDKHTVDLILLDITMPGMDGMEFLRKIKSDGADPDVIMVTASNTVRNAIDAMKLGAVDYIVKPWDVDEIKISVDRAVERKALARHVANLKSSISRVTFDEIVTNSPVMKSVLDLTRQMCGNESRVLIIGETGTGKELIARAIHDNGTRKEMPFVAVNCAAIPESLIESELFGYEQGAFSGATKQKKGRFELASCGTIFLDEISSLSLEVQAKLLRVLQEGTFERLGSERTRRVDVRVISATNHDIPTLIKEGKFREDLYFRLNVVPIALPPLRERKEDIPLLAGHFLKRFNEKFHKKIKGFSKQAISALMQYNWPGNVREFENLVERMAVLEEEREIGHEKLPLEILIARHKKDGFPSADAYLESAIEEFERQYILNALKKSDWNQSKAADLLKVHRNTIAKKINQYDIPTHGHKKSDKEQ